MKTDAAETRPPDIFESTAIAVLDQRHPCGDTLSSRAYRRFSMRMRDVGTMRRGSVACDHLRYPRFGVGLFCHSKMANTGLWIRTIDLPFRSRLLYH